MTTQTTVQKLVLGRSAPAATAEPNQDDHGENKDCGSEPSSAQTKDGEKKAVMTETVSVRESGESSRPITTEQILAQRRREKIQASGGSEPEPKAKSAPRRVLHSMLGGIAAGNPWMR